MLKNILWLFKRGYYPIHAVCQNCRHHNSVRVPKGTEWGSYRAGLKCKRCQCATLSY